MAAQEALKEAATDDAAAAFLDANVSECAFSVMDAEKMELKVLDSDMDEAAETSDKEADRREELNDDAAAAFREDNSWAR